eukprot:CAMPEP_0185842366 /NCGR_PEP_ID=MMETSP1353-20130828/18371_1 /TAXON_ID=1077150 /ORGANISM="Erythrolobus australicus, Strain CCMP3124" /LENGTH=76 /DNA_ID=CAMNT_0028541867 /DNA_START=558 /DNA_END=785 /DNA_ORIENTATION=-
MAVSAENAGMDLSIRGRPRERDDSSRKARREHAPDRLSQRMVRRKELGSLGEVDSRKLSQDSSHSAHSSQEQSIEW